MITGTAEVIVLPSRADRLERRVHELECALVRLGRENNDQCDTIFGLQEQLRKADEKNAELRRQLDDARKGRGRFR